MTTAFPLLRLPYLVLMPVLEQMEFMERIALSILSKRARMFLKLLKMKCEYINLILEDNKIKMAVLFDDSEKLRVDVPMIGDQEVLIIGYYQNLKYGHDSNEYDYFAWWPGTLSPMDYVLPIMDVTYCKSIRKLIFLEVSEYDPGYDTTIPLLTKLFKIDEVIVDDFPSYSFSWDSRLQNVLKIVFPVTSAVTIPYHALKPEDLREIIRGNFESVTVRKYHADYMPNHDMKFSLNDLKMTNVRSLKLAGPAFTLEDLNHYFKLWKKKKSNPRLKYLQVAIRKSERSEIMRTFLKEFKVVLMNPTRTKDIKPFISEIENERFPTELYISRADGRGATVRIGTEGTVCFYVCPESTNDTTNREPNQSLFMRKFPFISNFYNSCIERFK
ncbi:hypothetical protein GCK72_021109 [Caenorhabditis remanei]|uniref:F-box domain-containing protein n=1 Tax=Caenorhabditis remanei TaxID=31234 RepID=A0A6A5GIN3_CAERE|nr:hypothetical protein GCK72_021109 [Caenorhabditis remanei]KAF1754546.1 hypothetical protein GCK72_021109 [Caenorhabditis remanei]